MSEKRFMNSALQLDFACHMIRLVMEQAHEDDKGAIEFAAIRLAFDAITNGSEDKEKCINRMQARLFKLMAEVE